MTFSTPESSSRMCEAGYAKVVSPDRKGYAVLKPTLGRTRSDYQQLLRPCEGMKFSGIIIHLILPNIRHGKHWLLLRCITSGN